MRSFGLLSIVALGVALVGCSDGTPQASCGPSNCTGCCAGAICRTGSELSACGRGGAACQSCPGGQSCQAGICSVTSVCNASNCSGCCDGTGCQPGNTNILCGRSGETCKQCVGGSSCNGGQCLTGSSCNGTSCPSGCCSGNQCMPGNAPAACGTGGAACQNCGAGSCSGGKCAGGGTCNAATCAGGCCFGNNCILSPTAEACGTGGGLCLRDNLEPNDACATAATLPVVEEGKGFVMYRGMMHGANGTAENDYFAFLAHEGLHVCNPTTKQCAFKLTAVLDVPAGRRLRLCLQKGGCSGTPVCKDSPDPAPTAHSVQIDDVAAGTCGLSDDVNGVLQVSALDGKGTCELYTVRVSYDYDSKLACP